MKALRYILLLSVVTGSSLAVAAATVSANPPQPRAAIVVDEESAVSRFMIDGKEQARIDHVGLHVEGDLTFVGTIKDAGPAPAAVTP